MSNPSINSPSANYRSKRLTREQSNQLAWQLISDFWIPPALPGKAEDNVSAPPLHKSRAMQARSGKLCD